MGVEVENCMELLSPYAPLWPWLARVLSDAGHTPIKVYSFPLCPKCSATMEPVRQGKSSALNSEQFDSVKAGDWFCRCHNNDRGNQPFGYYRERELPPLYSIDLRPFAMRAVALHALASVGYSLPWALGDIWSPLDNEQAGRAVAEAIRRVGEDPGKPCGVVPLGLLGLYERGTFTNPPGSWSRRYVVAGEPPQILSNLSGKAGENDADSRAAVLGALLWEQVTPEEVKA